MIGERFRQYQEKTSQRVKGDILAHAEREFLEGSNHFEAAPAMAKRGLWLVNGHRGVISGAYDDIIDMLKANNAQGAIYAVESGPGNDASAVVDDHVIVYSRDGNLTDVQPERFRGGQGGHYVTIKTTGGFEIVEQ